MIFDWNPYANGKQSEVVPACYSFYVTGDIKKTPFTNVPFMLSAIRYRVGEDIHLLIDINNREYGDWKLYQPSGLILVNPKLLLASDDIKICFYALLGELDFSLDGERIRKL